MNALTPSARQGLLLHQVSHAYGTMPAVQDVTLDIRPGEMVALLGPSGCGKTTLLKCIAGFERQRSGRISIGAASVDSLPPNRRRVGIVFQNYALFPHMTAAQNVAYGLDVQGLPRTEKAARVAEMLALVHMDGMAGRLPRQLSGGQQQRVAIARALAVRPGVLLLDEPFAALDKALRMDMQIEVKRIQRTAGTTTIIVTHDQEEAMGMADRVAVLSRGRLEQFAPPTEIYDRPASLFVNTFVGTANVLPGTVLEARGDRLAVRLDAGAVVEARAGQPLRAGERAAACLRPEAVELLPAEAGGTGGDARTDGLADALAGTVEVGLPLGATVLHEVRLADGTAVKVSAARAQGAAPLPPGTPVSLRPAGGAAAYPHP